jgi:glycerol-3-phosphate dehydrogenase subunit B
VTALAADVVVVGGGLAGAVAALAARAAGAAVVLVRRAPGATALSGGAIGVAPDLDALPFDPLVARHSPLESARRLAARRPDHPYALLGVAALEEALAFAAAELSALLEPPDGRPRFLAHVSGGVAECALCQRTQAAGDLRRIRGALAVAGFAGHLGFDARLVASGVARRLAAGGPEALAVEVDWPTDPAAGALRPVELARALEVPGAAEALGAALRQALPRRVAVAVLPPVLGLDPAARVAERVAAAAGVPVAEAVSDPPSVPGLRLDAAILARLAAAGVTLLRGEARPGGRPGRPVQVVLADGGEAEVTAPSLVLATGRFIAGGVVRRGALTEPLLGLPVQASESGASGVRLAGRPAATLTVRERRAAQPLLAAGLKVDGSCRPLGDDGLPVHYRLFAAGALVGGHEHAADGTGLGVAILSGFLAGRGAAAGGPR